MLKWKFFVIAFAFGVGLESFAISEIAQDALTQMGVNRGICVVAGLPNNSTNFVTDLVEGSELLIYFQSPDENDVADVRQSAEEAGLLGSRVFVEQGDGVSIHLADNLADALWVPSTLVGATTLTQDEILRVIHPEGVALIDDNGTTTPLVKPFPAGIKPWSHPYYGPGNNPRSMDQVARHPNLTQYMDDPLSCTISQVTIGAGGRLFKAFGEWSPKAVHNDALHKLYCINGYNGTILWTRPLKEGFMIHRNTMIATTHTLYLADDESCKLIDARTGEIQDEIIPSPELMGGTVWKWMAMEDGVLYAMIGSDEIETEFSRSSNSGYGHWKWDVWRGYDYADGEKNFGFGRTLVAIQLDSKQILWHRTETNLLDSRGVCMKDGKIYIYSPGNFLASIDAQTGDLLWKRTDAEMINAIGSDGVAQYFTTGFSTSTYIKTDGVRIVIAGPQRPKLLTLSCETGDLLWQKDSGNYQTIFWDDALYAIGQQNKTSYKWDYTTGATLTEFDGRRACTRATASYDSLYFRARGGTIRYGVASNLVEHIAPMRPSCQDGVIISDGMMHWGPWFCGCHISLVGSIGLAPANGFDFTQAATEEERLKIGSGDLHNVQTLEGTPSEANNVTTCGNLRFSVGDDGVLNVENTQTGTLEWKAYTAGSINYPPSIWSNRAFVGSNDGWIYAFEATTGRLLWKFRGAPVERKVNIYGDLMSTWPIGGGVRVSDNGVLYAAAGIAHYDGTHVYALNAITGEIIWQNNTSGSLSSYKTGISLQGRLDITSSNLTFCGGNACPDAFFDLDTGACLTPAPTKPKGKKNTKFYGLPDFMAAYRSRPNLLDFVQTVATNNTSVEVIAKTKNHSGTNQCKLVVYSDAGFTVEVFRSPTATVATTENDSTVTLTADTGLETNTPYHYRIEVNGVEDERTPGYFKTTEDSGTGPQIETSNNAAGFYKLSVELE